MTKGTCTNGKKKEEKKRCDTEGKKWRERIREGEEMDRSLSL